MKTKHVLQPDDIAERTGKIRRAVEQMTDLIDNLINSAILFEGNPELYFHPADIDLAAIMKRCLPSISRNHPRYANHREYQYSNTAYARRPQIAKAAVCQSFNECH